MFDTAEGNLLREANVTAASEVHSLAFSSNSRCLAASGDNGTVQIFDLQADASHMSASQFRTGEGERCVVAFGAQINTVVAVRMGGSFYRCQFDPVAGGEMKQLEHCDFM